MASIILAGGANRRFGGRIKARELLGGVSLVERVLQRLQPLGEELILVTDRGEAFPDFPGRVVSDSGQPRGPMRGITAGLKASRDCMNLVVGCDMPFLRTDLLRFLWQGGKNCDVLMPRLGVHLEPLHALYSRSLIPHLQLLLDQGEFRLQRVLEAPVRVCQVSEEVLRHYDPELRSFFNVNCPADLLRAGAYLAEEDGFYGPNHSQSACGALGRRRESTASG